MKSATIVMLSLLGIATGCTTRVDGKKVEHAIKEQTAAMKLELTTVTCPPTAPDTVGEAFTCTATDTLGTQSTVDVKVTDAALVRIEWKAQLPFEKMEVLGDNLEKALEQKVGKKVDVKCPPKNVFIKLGTSFTCEASDGTQARKVKMTFADDKGGCSFEVL
jgi:hypothetical protein